MSAGIIIGLGNEFRRDDAVGLLAARELRAKGMRAVDYDGAPAALIDRWSGAAFVILIDAVSSGADPGAVHRFDASASRLPRDAFKSSTHALGVADAVELSRALGTLPARVVVFGVEAQDVRPGNGLTSEVRRALPIVIERVLSCVKDLEGA